MNERRATDKGPFRLPRADGGALGGAVRGVVERLLALDRLDEAYLGLERGLDPFDFAAAALDALGVDVAVREGDLARIPAEGPVVVVANHPFGGVEGMVLARLLGRVRPDVRLVVNRMLGRIPELRELFFLVDVFGGERAARENVAPLRRAMRWARDGGLLAFFPAGEVSHLHLRRRQVQDPAWNPNVARVARAAGATVVPVYFDGRNGGLFQMAGLVHPRLRTALLPRELLNKGRCRLEVRVGRPISPARLNRLATDDERIAYLRARTELLRHRSSRPEASPEPAAVVPVAAPMPAASLAAEVDALPDDRTLARQGALRTVLFRAVEAPALMAEIARLRERTFRDAGEGTGRASDRDRFDPHYLHLAVFDDGARRIAGACRMGPTDRILRAHGPDGLYTSTLFKFRRGFFDRLGPALELGRSFVVPEHQRDGRTLGLLWKGIARFVARHPRYRTLFGPVSSSAVSSKASQALMVEWIKRFAMADGLKALVRPRRRPRLGAHCRAVRESTLALEGLNELSAGVLDLEPEPRGVPVLVREYLKLGGRFCAFHRDPDFADVLDALVVVDLFGTPRRVLERNMGREGAEGFLAFHAARAGIGEGERLGAGGRGPEGR
ncbi:MAG: lysophospholipid acyltransferase family protein [Planctomycetota bacterium JB042]